MGALFNTVLYNPLFQALVWLYDKVAFHDLGIAIVLLTIIIRIILFPLFFKSGRNQLIMQKLQPEMQRIQTEHKDDREKQAMAMLELYKTHKVNPFSGFILLFIQLPILIALFKVFKQDFPALNHMFLGLIDLKARSIIIVICAAIAQYFQGRLAMPPAQKGRELSSTERIGRNMVFMGPVLTIVMLTNFPSAVGLYWLTTSLFSIAQQWYINKTVDIEHGKV